MEYYVKISQVLTGSQAERLGIQTEDILISLADQPIKTMEEFKNIVAQKKNEQCYKANLIIERNNQPKTLVVDLTTQLGIIGDDYHGDKTGDDKGDLGAAPQLSASAISVPTQYGTTRAVCAFLLALGTLSVIVGILFALTALMASYRGINPFEIILSLAFVAIGLGLIVGAQVTRATVDNADHSREILKILQERLKE